MTLALTPPSSIDTSLKLGDNGWGVFGLQHSLNFSNQASLVTDGVFGQNTEAAVTKWQKRMGLFVDGIAGPNTQRSLVTHVCDTTFVESIPKGLGKSIVEGESGYWLGAVNWGVSGGVDCGIVQERVLGPPFALDNLKHAFRAPMSLSGALLTLAGRAHDYGKYAWAGVSWERQMRCAVMAHNWPAGALSIAKTGRCSDPDSPANWVPAGVKFPDGASVVTRWEWCQWYAMGGPHGEARMTRYVDSWIV